MNVPFDRDQWQWNSRTNYPDGHLKPFKADKYVVHWGGYTDPGDGEADEQSVLRGWQRYHMDSRGWVDIAYNFAVGNSGVIYRCRGVNRSGATSGDYENDGIRENNEAIAIVWIGGSGHQPSPEAYESMARIINANPMPVIVHRDVKSTACPGDDWNQWVKLEGWKQYLGTPSTPPPKGDEYEMETVRRGDGYNSKGTAYKRATVKSAQIMLAYRGFADERTADGTCGADGIFGPGTETAVKNFQTANGLVIDGVVGPSTWGKLEGW